MARACRSEEDDGVKMEVRMGNSEGSEALSSSLTFAWRGQIRTSIDEALFR
jgi:hypothetical protein